MYGKKRVKRQFGGPGLLQLLFGVAYTDNVEKVNIYSLVINIYILKSLP